jgi:hypothetical protein
MSIPATRVQLHTAFKLPWWSTREETWRRPRTSNQPPWFEEDPQIEASRQLADMFSRLVQEIYAAYLDDATYRLNPEKRTTVGVGERPATRAIAIRD